MSWADKLALSISRKSLAAQQIIWPDDYPDSPMVLSGSFGQFTGIMFKWETSKNNKNSRPKDLTHASV
jgi:hypothetical protein